MPRDSCLKFVCACVWVCVVDRIDIDNTNTRYKAPEILVDRPYYTEAVDCWSLGVIFFIMLSGGPPFYEDEEGGIDLKVVRGIYRFEAEEWESVSEDAKDFIRKILVVDPKRRLTCAQMLQHRYDGRRGCMGGMESNEVEWDQTQLLVVVFGSPTVLAA